jgi:hypothetical protein
MSSPLFVLPVHPLGVGDLGDLTPCCSAYPTDTGITIPARPRVHTDSWLALPAQTAKQVDDDDYTQDCCDECTYHFVYPSFRE